MRLLSLIAYYFWWHYTTAISDLVGNYVRLASFLNEFFSLRHLAAHLLSPWRRLGEQYPARFDLGAYFSAFIVNTLMRLVGALVRLLILVVGLVALALSVLAFFAVLITWLLLPVILIFLLVLGYRLLVA